MGDTEYRQFIQSIIDNVKKNGFPDKKVAFPLEQMYELAEKKGMNFNKVLKTLEEIQICHQKTPEKIIFYPKKDEPKARTGGNPLDAFASMASNIDPEMLKGKSIPDMMAAATQMMQNMDPGQLEAIKDAYDNMSDEEKAQIMENAKKMGLF